MSQKTSNRKAIIKQKMERLSMVTLIPCPVNSPKMECQLKCCLCYLTDALNLELAQNDLMAIINQIPTK